MLLTEQSGLKRELLLVRGLERNDCENMMVEMSSTPTTRTDQHYVPQLLLRGFGHGTRNQVYVYDKSDDRTFRSSVRNIACERGFYNLQSGDQPDRVDEWLRKLENRCGPIVQKVRQTKRLSVLANDERQWLAAFVAVQHVRTLHHRAVYADMNRQMANALRNMGTDPNSVQNFRELTDEEVREETNAAIQQRSFAILPHLLNKDWLLFSADSNSEFILGDHPVVLANNMNPGDGLVGTLGLAVRGIEIYLPLSSNLMLGCFCPSIRAMFTEHADRLRRFGLAQVARSDDFLRAFDGSSTLALAPDNVKYHNSLQVVSAERFVFSSHDFFDVVRDMITRNGSVRSGERVQLSGPGTGNR